MKRTPVVGASHLCRRCPQRREHRAARLLHDPQAESAPALNSFFSSAGINAECHGTLFTGRRGHHVHAVLVDDARLQQGIALGAVRA